jgi:hypothetical protein
MEDLEEDGLVVWSEIPKRSFRRDSEEDTIEDGSYG